MPAGFIGAADILAPNRLTSRSCAAAVKASRRCRWRPASRAGASRIRSLSRVEGLERLPSSSHEEPVMQERAFGRTGLAVSALGFGSWPMSGGDRYGAIEDAEAIRTIC